MAKLEYRTYERDCREASVITFDVPEDMDVYEYKLICKRLAYALGYSHSSIQNIFTPDKH